MEVLSKEQMKLISGGSPNRIVEMARETAINRTKSSSKIYNKLASNNVVNY